MTSNPEDSHVHKVLVIKTRNTALCLYYDSSNVTVVATYELICIHQTCSTLVRCLWNIFNYDQLTSINLTDRPSCS